MYSQDRKLITWRKPIHPWISDNSTPIVQFDINPRKENINIKNVHRNRQASRSIFQRIVNSIDSYCGVSSLHGLRYVGDPNITYGERFFWLISFLTAAAFAVYFIAALYQKFDRSPVIMSFSPSVTRLSELPFPAVTLCNVNNVKLTLANKIKDGSEMEKRMLSDYCDDENTTFAENALLDNLTSDWATVKKFILSLGQTCEEMIPVCFYQMNDCSSFINQVLTDEGLCCTFNRLPNKLSYRYPLDATLNETYPEEIIDWNPEVGYPDKSNLDDYPKRTKGAGANLGLTLVLDTLVSEYYCSSTNSVGFKVLLSNPIDKPQIADYAFLLSAGLETRVRIVPSIKDATPTIRSIDVEKRQCYFSDEKYLKFFRIYTERNCLLECLTNYTYKKCHCVPYFLPRTSRMTVCSKQDEICVFKAKREVDSNLRIKLHCHCLPGCHELTFDQSLSFGRIHAKSDLIIKPEMRAGKSLQYAKENFVIVHFFFQETKFIKYTKSELYGFSEFLSNTGGLLGLFLGFSFLSAVELLYYVSLRLICKSLAYRRNKNQLSMS